MCYPNNTLFSFKVKGLYRQKLYENTIKTKLVFTIEILSPMRPSALLHSLSGSFKKLQ